MSAHDYKAPPALSKSDTYDTWLKKIKIWQKFTSLPKGKQGPAIFLTLEGRAEEAILELDVDVISADTGVDAIIAQLNKLYLKDKTQSAYEAYENFEKFKRPKAMTINDYINEFERLKCKTKQHGTEMSTDILAYRLLKSANLSESHEQLAKATIVELTYENMKSQLKKIFGESSSNGIDGSFSEDVKVEPIYESTDVEGTYYGNNFKYQRGGRGQSNAFRQVNQAKTAAYRGRGQFKVSRGAGFSGSCSNRKGRNPLNSKGEITRCSICDSVNHWMVNCPDSVYYQESSKEECLDEEDSNHEVTLFQSNLITDDHMKTFVCESFGMAILDSGATATVAGSVWMKCYLDSLHPDVKSKITHSTSHRSFKFGSGETFKSLYKIEIPAKIGSKDITIETDLVECDVPMLLSRNSMKKANTSINFKDDLVNMFGEDLEVIVTSSGHYAVPLNRSMKVLDDAATRSKGIILHMQTVELEDKKKVAQKLHSQFSHPSANRLIKLIDCAGLGNDRSLIEEINKLSKTCQICKEYKKQPPRPVAGMPLASEFNEVVALDLKMFEGKWFIHLIDHVSRFSAASFIQTKKSEEIIDKIFQIWISIFGPPKKFLSDNGGEFNNSEFRDLCESFNITVLTTAAEAPWSNGLCERHNAVLADMLQKTYAEGKCNLKTALCWAVHSKNSLSNVHGFSPYQLAIGYTPNLPCNLSNDPPALECSSSEIVQKNLNAIASARRSFIESESSEKVKRALRHNLSPASSTKYFTGDCVYYKRNDSKKWKGLGTVIGQDSQQVLIKHGGIYVRVHPCRVMLNKPSHMKSTRKSGSSTSSENDLEDNGGDDLTIRNCESSEDEDQQQSNDSALTGNSPSRTSNQTADPEIPVENVVSEQSSQNYGTLHKGSTVEYLPEQGRDWIKCKLHSRAGKVGGKYKSWWNVVEGDAIKVVNFDDVSWRESVEPVSNESGEDEYTSATDDDDEEVSYCDVFLSQVDEETLNAKVNELANWKSEEVYQEVKDCGQEAISVRWVVTPKLVDGVWKTKARLVARGFEEDNSSLRTDSPTCMRETLRIVLTIAAGRKWNINSIDIKAAFLQGKAIDRQVFLRPPKEAEVKGSLWLLKKAVYGLSDASRVWYLRVVEELAKLGVEVSKYDKALFIWRRQGIVDGIIVAHVDDFLWCGSEDFHRDIIMKLKSVFKVSKQSEGMFKYIGIDLRQKEGCMTLSQRSYTQSVKEIKLPKIDACMKQQEVGSELRRAFRGVVGQISWVAGMSRPDAAFNACSLSTVQSKATYRDLFEANKAVRDLKSNDLDIIIPCMDLSTLNISVYSDASYGNLKDGGSQGGHIVFISDSKGVCAPISWSSKKIKRVARSTLGAETLSAVDALDSAYLVAKILTELVDVSEREIATSLFTDNKSLYDALNTSNLLLDKRLRVDISALREMNDRGEVSYHWVESSQQLADVLTKRGASKRKLFGVLGQATLEN